MLSFSSSNLFVFYSFFQSSLLDVGTQILRLHGYEAMNVFFFFFYHTFSRTIHLPSIKTGECDIVLAQSKDFGNGLGFAVHVRTKARYEYSYIQSAAIKIGEDTLEVTAFGDYLLGGVVSADLPSQMADAYTVTRTTRNHEVTFDIEVSTDDHIYIKTYKDLVSVRFSGSEESEFGDVIGIMGDYHNGTHFSRDGLRIIEDNNEFGQEWQVRPSLDGQLFQRKSIVTEGACIIPDPVKEERRRLGESISVEAAERACEHFHTKGAFNACVYDVIAMGDLGAAQAGAA